MNRIRQEQAGIDRYEWNTVQDERVRQLHKSLNGREYEWGKPTGAEGGLPPGQPIQCRCVASGIVEFGIPRKGKKKPDDLAPATEVPTATRAPRRGRRPATVPVRPGAVPFAPPVPAVDPVAARNMEFDLAAQRWTVERGRKDKKEHLTAYDAVTGQDFGKVDGRHASVPVPAEVLRGMRDPQRKIVIHHNHPEWKGGIAESGPSFSDGDMYYINSPGISGMWAHAHNGTSYFAEKNR